MTVGVSAAPRRCESCGAELGLGRADRRYCDAACRQSAFRRRRDTREPVSAPEPTALEQLLDVERLVGVLARHAYGGHPTSWRSALTLLQTLYPGRWSNGKP